MNFPRPLATDEMPSRRQKGHSLALSRRIWPRSDDTNPTQTVSPCCSLEMERHKKKTRGVHVAMCAMLWLAQTPWPSLLPPPAPPPATFAYLISSSTDISVPGHTDLDLASRPADH